MKYYIHTIVITLMLLTSSILVAADDTSISTRTSKKRIAYITSDINIPFWQIVAKGISSKADEENYEILIYSSQNSIKKELESTVSAIKENVDGMIISPITSASCVTVLRLAKRSNTPVVIADIGTDRGDHVSYISSNNEEGAYKIGKILTEKMTTLGWSAGSVGIVAIPQKRLNGQARTRGFIKALHEAGIKSADIRQQIDFSYEETYSYVKEMIESNALIRAIWLQGSDKYKAALNAIEDMGKKDQILLLTFDAEPEFLDLIAQGTLVGSAMQQPFLIGEYAFIELTNYINKKEVQKVIILPVLDISSNNLSQKLSTIKRNVLGLTR